MDREAEWFSSSGKQIFSSESIWHLYCNNKLFLGPYSGTETPRASVKPKHRGNDTIPGIETGTVCVGSISGGKNVLGLRQNTPPSLLSTQLTKVKLLRAADQKPRSRATDILTSPRM